AAGEIVLDVATYPFERGAEAWERQARGPAAKIVVTLEPRRERPDREPVPVPRRSRARSAGELDSGPQAGGAAERGGQHGQKPEGRGPPKLGDEPAGDCAEADADSGHGAHTA